MRVIVLFALFISSISILIRHENVDQFDQISNEIKDKLATKVKIAYESYPSPEKKFDKYLVDSWFRTRMYSGFYVAQTESIENLNIALVNIKQKLVDHFKSKSTETRLIEDKVYDPHLLVVNRGKYMNFNYTIGASHYENGKLYYYYILINSILGDTYDYDKNMPIMEYDTYLKMNTIRLENEERILREKRPKDRKLKMYLSLKEEIKSNYCKGDDIKNVEINIERSGFKTQKRVILEGMTRDVKLYFDTFDKKRVQEIVTKYNLNSIILEQLNELVYSRDSIRQKNLYFNISNQLGSFKEIFGIASKENDIIFIAFAESDCHGKVVNIELYDDNVNHCVTENKKKAGTHYNCFTKQSGYIQRINKLIDCILCCPYVPFEFTGEEKNAIKDGLAKFSIRGIMTKLEEMETSITYIHNGMEIPSNNMKFIAKIGDNGMIYVGEYSNKDTLFTNYLYTVGEPQIVELKPYEIIISESGQLYILDQNKSRAWSTKYPNIQGELPFKLILTDNGDLEVLDANDQTIYNLRK